MVKKEKIEEPVAAFIGFLIMLLFIGLIIYAVFETNKKDDSPACNQADITCNANKMSSVVGILCKEKIERLALHSVKWTSGALSRFSRYQESPVESGAITFFGDKAQFQNGFGAYTNVVYECTVKFNGTTMNDYSNFNYYKIINARIVREGYIDSN